MNERKRKKTSRFHILIIILMASHIFNSFFLFWEITRYSNKRDEYDNGRYNLTSKWKVIIKVITNSFFRVVYFLPEKKRIQRIGRKTKWNCSVIFVILCFMCVLLFLIIKTHFFPLWYFMNVQEDYFFLLCKQATKGNEPKSQASFFCLFQTDF